MYPDKLRRLLCLALAATFFIALPSFAQRRRAVNHPSAGGLITAAEVSGTVVDNVTGAPVIAVKVEGGGDSDLTDKDGRFTLKNLESFGGVLNIDASRSGYVTKRTPLTTGGTHTLNIRLDPTPTVRVRRIDNSTFDLDFESILFGYPVAFSGYRSAEFEEFCRPDGTTVTIDRSQIKRITGPLAELTYAPCCPNAPTAKVNVELKTGEKMDMYFVDACNGFPNIDLIGREHVNAKFQYIPFKQIAEVIFP
ncbi:MAG TPA: carboxypeptidase regulatory-like domain-containing protein [Thermoanaerobaculia bacterium]|nr:carboxypeptidase regulatory-like domain-containing protein [Thermoanaerobaculia bacterium]